MRYFILCFKMKVLLFLVLVPIVYGTGGLLGAPEEGDKNDPQILQIANSALDKLNEKENSLSRSLDSIVSVKTQIVAGVKYMFVLNVKRGDLDETCELTVVVVPWLHQFNLTESTCRPAQKKLGGEKAAGKDEVQDAIKVATDYHNRELDSLYRVGVHSVENMKKKTVAGILFTFTLTFKQTNCFNDGSKKLLKECPVNVAGEETKCNYTVLFQGWQKTESQYTVTSEKCSEQQKTQPTVKSDMATKLRNLLKEHKIPTMDELSMPNEVLPLFGKQQNELSNHINPVLKRKKKSVDSFEPLMQHIGKNVLEALKHANKEHPDLKKELPDLDKLFGKDGHDLGKHGFDKLLGADNHDLIKHGLDKLLGGDGHDLLQHGIQQLLGGDDHDLEKHGLDKLLGGDEHDFKKHGGLIGGDDHDFKKHGGLIGGDDHDFKKHGGLIGGDDHDFKKHGGLIGGDEHDFKKHGGLIGGDDHDFKKHGGLIGGDDHDFKKHGGLIGGDDHDFQQHGTNTPTNLGGDGHDLCHLGHFKEFIIKHGKVYETVDEENKRFAVFCKNMAYARHLNETEKGTAWYGATKFADLTQEEFRQKYLSKKNWDDIPNNAADKMWRAKIPKGERPTSFDWRDKGAVTPVKNQGQCGSCWAFSTTGNIEGQWKIQQGNLVSLSEQELVDCDKLDDGCNGGLPSNAYESIMKLGGLETEGEYKYEGEDEKCMFNKSEVAVTITGAVNISSNEDDMASWLAQNGPISIGINANAMQFYFGGISHPWKIFCNPSSLDHGVLIVGYGVEKDEPFWIVKNSWGPDWGEEGYYRVYRGGGVCGLNRMCTSAVVN